MSILHWFCSKNWLIKLFSRVMIDDLDACSTRSDHRDNIMKLTSDVKRRITNITWNTCILFRTFKKFFKNTNEWLFLWNFFKLTKLSVFTSTRQKHLYPIERHIHSCRIPLAHLKCDSMQHLHTFLNSDITYFSPDTATTVGFHFFLLSTTMCVIVYPAMFLKSLLGKLKILEVATK